MMVFAAPSIGHAFYNPEQGRWLSRDPMTDSAIVAATHRSYLNYGNSKPSRLSFQKLESVAPNPHIFSGNCLVNVVDKLGLVIISPPPAKLDEMDTVICDGKGGFEIVTNGKLTPLELVCLLPCIIKHEEKHVEMFEQNYPNICIGQSRGSQPSFDDPIEEAVYEARAWMAQVDCLEAAAKKCTSQCEKTLLKEINFAIWWRDVYRKRLPTYPY